MAAAGERMAAAQISPYGGIWYPPQQRRLNALLDELFETSCRRTGPHVLPGALAALVPHAAPRYSGTVAAAAYRHVQLAKPERVFILGFSHAGGQRGVAIPNVARYRTALGEIAVDASSGRALYAAAPFRLVDESEACDHSVESQLPFLQRVAPAARVIRLYVGQLEEEERTAAAQALARAYHPGDVLLASSDLTHYGPSFGYVPFPVDSLIAARLRELDRAVLAAASSLDCGLFFATLRKSGATACGYQPISLLLRTLSLMDGEDIFQQELDYQTSGEITGEFCEGVSYAAAGYFRKNSFELNEAEQTNCC
jgi:AmmeMemoRadiSam system protein B